MFTGSNRDKLVRTSVGARLARDESGAVHGRARHLYRGQALLPHKNCRKCSVWLKEAYFFTSAEHAAL